MTIIVTIKESIDKFKYIKMNFSLGHFLKNKNHVKEELLSIKRHYKGTENISHHLGKDIYIHATDQGLNIKIYHKCSSKIKNLIEKWEKHYELNFIEASIRTAYKQKRTC